MFSRIYFFLVIISMGCRNRPTVCKFTVEKPLSKDSAKVITTKTVDDVSTEFRDKERDNTRAGYYVFRKDGSLKTYYFFGNM